MQSNKTYYKKKYHGSVIIYYLSKFAKRVANLAKSSILLGFFCDFDNLEGKYKSSVTSGIFEASHSLRQKSLALKLKIAMYSQNSILLGLFEKAEKSFLRSNLRTLGIFFMSFGGYIISVNLVTSLDNLLFFNFTDTFIFGCILFLISFLLLPFKNKSIGTYIHESKILSYFLFDVFALNIPGSGEKSKVNTTSGFYAFIGIACGVLSHLVSPWLVISIALIIAVLWMVLKKPENGILLICLVLPFSSLKIIESIILVTAISLLFKVIRGKRTLGNGVIALALLILSIITLSSTVYSFDGKYASEECVYVLSALFLSYAVITLINSSSLAERCFKMFMISSAFTALYGLYEYLKIYLENIDFSGSALKSILGGGMSSVFESQQFFAAYLICIIPLFFARRIKGGKAAPLIGIILLTGCLILTNSYYAVLSLAISAVISLLIFSRYGIFTAALFALLLPLIKNFIPTGYTRPIDEYVSQMSLSSHLHDVTNGVAEHISSFWLGGSGIGSQAPAMAALGAGSGLLFDASYGGIYINIVLKIGIPLTVMSGIMILAIMSRPFSYTFQKNVSLEARSKCIAILCSLCSILICGLFYNVFADYRIFFLFFLLLSLGTSVADSAEKDYVPEHTPRELLY